MRGLRYVPTSLPAGYNKWCQHKRVTRAEDFGDSPYLVCVDCFAFLEEADPDADYEITASPAPVPGLTADDWTILYALRAIYEEKVG